MHQVLLDFFRIGVAGKVEPVREPDHVRVHDHADRDAERRAEDDVRRLARHSRQRQQFLHRARHFAAELFHDFLARAHDGLGLVPEKARGPDVLLEFRRIRVGKILWRAIFHEERFGDLVDALVRALRRKNRGNQQLKRSVVLERAGHVRIGFIQLLQNRAHALRIRSRSLRIRAARPGGFRLSRAREAFRSLSRIERQSFLALDFGFFIVASRMNMA